MSIPESEWEWGGSAGHFICGSDCRFHLCTFIGSYMVSTVGEYFPDAPVREIHATSRGITLEGRGDARRADYMARVGFEDVGFGRKYETMVFRLSGERCSEPTCGCNLPTVGDWSELDSAGYNERGAAQRGHLAMCRTWAAKP